MANVKTFNDYRQPSGSRWGFGYSSLNASGRSGSSSFRSYCTITLSNRDGTTTEYDFVEAFFPEFKIRSFIFILTVVQVVVFIATKLAAKVLADSPYGYQCVLYECGAEFTPAITTYYQVHRLLMPTFLHMDFGHIFFNMLAQWLYGFRLESVYGAKKLLAFYMLSAIGGNLLSSVLMPISLGVGASTSLFGVIALYMAYLVENFHSLNRNTALFRLVVLFVMVVGNVEDAQKGGADDHVGYYAHIGGFFVGLCMSIIFFVNFSYRRYRLVKLASMVALVAYCGILAYKLSTMNYLGTYAWQMASECSAMLKLN